MANFRAMLTIDDQFRRGWQARTLAKRLGREADPDVGEVAAEFGLQRKTVTQFILDNSIEIAAIRNDPDNPFAGIWAADRDNRIRELLDEVVSCNILLRSMQNIEEDEDVDVDITGDWNMIVKLKMALLEAIARELGQTKPEIGVDGNVSFVINGIDVGALK